MHEVKPPDKHHLSAAIGWLELGNLAEAIGERAQISDVYEEFPEILELDWQLSSKSADWNAALVASERMCRIHPDNPSGWICQSYSLHELGRTQEAWDRLRAVVDRFEEESTMSYNLACYACQMGELAESRIWLKRAIEVSDEYRKMAESDPDLEPLKGELGSL